MTGRYPHRNGGEGFYHLRKSDVPILPALLRGGGYAVGLLGKLEHSTPYADFQWDVALDKQDLGMGRNPDVYARCARRFMEESIASGKPFFLMLNSHDPHRPFFGNDKEHWYDQTRTSPAARPPSRRFVPEEIRPPGFLPDLPEVRLELSEYYSSVKRCDDTVGAAMEVLDELEVADKTLVIFLSDNGMAFPFAKTNCYLHSTRTPWIVRWPEKVNAGRVESRQFVSGIDLMPTVLDVAGLPIPDGVDGQSFLPVLDGAVQAGRERVFTQFHQTAGRRNYPMRCIQDRRFGYIFNPWSDGARVFINESQAGRTMAAMKEAAEQDADLAARVHLFLYRVPEELYDFQNDPHALVNLVEDPRYADVLQRLRLALDEYMERTQDPALECFRHRDDPACCQAYLKEMGAELGTR